MKRAKTYRERIERVVASLPRGARFTTCDILAAFPPSSARAPGMRAVAAILAGLDNVVCEGVPPSHAPATWRRV